MTDTKTTTTAITPTRSQDYPEWYQQVIKAADLAENAPVKGCMVIKPWGYGIWERIQAELDRRIKDTGHENAYFPLFIPLSFLEKEASHIEGFAKECAVVTHHRLEARDGKLYPSGELDEPYIVRPTSETIIGDSFSKWIQSYRDLPVLINQWANVVRWEMRTRLFLRTTEFLWQEGHTAHATENEAIEEMYKMLDVYVDLAENILAIPVIKGFKPAHERFPGAEMTTCIEAMMQDRKALQAGTSHYLGQNFSSAFDIKFLNSAGQNEFVYTTSWGVSTRLIGGVIMTHSDDDGLKLPPKIAPRQVVILPVIPKAEMTGAIMKACDDLCAKIKTVRYGETYIDAIVDKKDIRGGEKNWGWIKKGIPIRIEIGPRDLESGKVALSRRDRDHKNKDFIAINELPEKLVPILDEIQNNYFKAAQNFTASNTVDSIKTFNELKDFFTPKNKEKPEIHGGFVKAKWSENADSVKLLEELKVSIRCIPIDQSGTSGKCILTGEDALLDVILAKSY